MRVEFDLEFSVRPSGTALTGQVDFVQPTRYLLFAWRGNELAWAKSSFSDGLTGLDICYHRCIGTHVQLITWVGNATSESLMLTTSHMPEAGTHCSAELSVPSVLYTKLDHGMGLLALPRGLTKSRRKGLWHIRPEAFTPELRLFEQAYGRRGVFMEHPFSDHSKG